MNIYCPNCQNKIGKDIFSRSDEPREYYCDNCNTSFSLSLVDIGEETENNSIVGSELNLTTENGENYTWKKTDDNLDPVLSCVACANELGENPNGENQSKKCRKCGLILNIFIS